jgi:hypothetical protein
MKKGAWGIALMILLATAASANAEGWKPYVGACIQPKVTYAMYDSSSSGVYSYHPAFSSAGQLEIGVLRNNWELYVGYLFTNSYEAVYSLNFWTDEYTQHRFIERNRWKDRRIVLGGRWYPNYQSDQRIQPILGAGITIGYSYLSADRLHTVRYYGFEGEYSEQNISIDQKDGYSKLSLGQLAEFGFIVDIYSNIDLRTMAQIHFADVRFDQEDSNIFRKQHVEEISVSCQFALIYRFAK